MALIAPIKRALGKFVQFASGDIISYLFLGTGGTNLGTKVLLDNNTWAAPPSGNLVYSNTSASTAITANGVETTFTVPSYSIPANSLVAGSVIRLKMFGIYTTSGIAPTINVKIKLNGTTYLATGAITAITGVTNGGWFGDVVLTVYSIGASGTVDAQAYGEFATAATTGLSVNVPSTATQTIDTTIAQPITVTITWGQASCSIQLRGVAIYIENLSTAATAGTFLQVANNLSDLNNAVTARANLGAPFTLTVLTLNFNPADATTYYFANLGAVAPSTTSTDADFNLGYAYKIIGVLIVAFSNTTAGTTESSTLQIRNTTQATSSSVGTFLTNASATVSVDTSIIGLNISVAAGDKITCQWDTPTWATNPVATRLAVTLVCIRQ